MRIDSVALTPISCEPHLTDLCTQIGGDLSSFAVTSKEQSPTLIDISPFHFTPGMQFGRYEIRGILGTGGMGEVYVAFDTNLERLVALKILRDTHVQDPAYLTRFRQEALSASALNHPHILTVYDVGISDGRHFISMELIEGLTIRKRRFVFPRLRFNFSVSDKLIETDGEYQ